MSHLVIETIHDLRWGRQSWRVMLMLSLPALAAGIATGLANLR